MLVAEDHHTQPRSLPVPFARRFSPSLHPPPPTLCRLWGRFEDPWADEDTVRGHPEKDVISYLETSASALGLALDREAKTLALRTLRSLTVVEGVDAGATTEAKTAADRPASPPAAEGLQTGTARNGSGVHEDIASERYGEVKNFGRISSVQDVYAAVTTALSEALVHCKRFEVRMHSMKLQNT